MWNLTAHPKVIQCRGWHKFHIWCVINNREEDVRRWYKWVVEHKNECEGERCKADDEQESRTYSTD